MRPAWIKVLIIASCLPLAAYPWLLSRMPAGGELDILMAIFPVYVLGSAICQWLCWPRRRELTWILLALQWLLFATLTIVAIYI